MLPLKVYRLPVPSFDLACMEIKSPQLSLTSSSKDLLLRERRRIAFQDDDEDPEGAKADCKAWAFYPIHTRQAYKVGAIIDFRIKRGRDSVNPPWHGLFLQLLSHMPAGKSRDLYEIRRLASFLMDGWKGRKIRVRREPLCIMLGGNREKWRAPLFRADAHSWFGTRRACEISRSNQGFPSSAFMQLGCWAAKNGDLN